MLPLGVFRLCDVVLVRARIAGAELSNEIQIR